MFQGMKAWISQSGYRIWNSTSKQLAILFGAFFLVVAAGALTLMLSTAEFKDPAHAGPWWKSFTHATYDGHISETENIGLSRALDVFVTFGGWFTLEVLFISVLTSSLMRRSKRACEGDIKRCHFEGGHGIILGWGDMGVSVVKQLSESGCGKIAILSMKNAEEITTELKNEIDYGQPAFKLKNIFVFRGPIDSQEEIKNLGFSNARDIVILGDQGVRGSDSRNLSAAILITDELRKSPSTRPAKKNRGNNDSETDHWVESQVANLWGNEDVEQEYKNFIEENKAREKNIEGLPNIYIHIADLRSSDLIQYVDVASGNEMLANIYPFNFYEDWARRIWCIPQSTMEDQVGKKSEEGSPSIPYKALAHDTDLAITESGKHVHLIVLGFGQMGQAIAMQATRIAHYPNGHDCPTLITAVDPRMGERETYFRSHYKGIETLSESQVNIGKHSNTIPDIKFQFLETHAEAMDIRKLLIEAANDPKQVVTVVVCMSDPDHSMSVALSLPPEILNAAIPVLIRQEIGSGLSTLANKIQHQEHSPWKDLYFFGMLNNCYGLAQKQDETAKLIHASYLAQAKVQGHYDANKPQYRDWVHLPEHYRWSNRYQADAFYERIRAFGYGMKPANESEVLRFPLEESERMAESEHDRWWTERLLAGWVYGKERDDALKVHSHLVPYAELDDDIKEYDCDAIRNMPRFLASGTGLGLEKQ